MRPVRTFFLVVLSIMTGLVCVAGNAAATEGYFQYGYGARQKALAGAGVADSRDATAAALNPAGLVDVDDQMNISASIFRPLRGFVGSGQPGVTPFGDIDSGRNYFLISNFAWSSPGRRQLAHRRNGLNSLRQWRAEHGV